MGHARVADRRPRQVERLEVRQGFQDGQSGVGCAGVRKREVLQFLLPSEAAQRDVADVRVLQAEVGDGVKGVQALRFRVADARADQRDSQLAVADEQGTASEQFGPLEKRAADDIDAAARLSYSGKSALDSLDFPGRPAADGREDECDEEQRPPPPALTTRRCGVW